MNATNLDRLISIAFSGGDVRRRELRLTADQAVQLQTHYHLSLTPLGEGWYEIIFQGALQS